MTGINPLVFPWTPRLAQVPGAHSPFAQTQSALDHLASALEARAERSNTTAVQAELDSILQRVPLVRSQTRGSSAPWNFRFDPPPRNGSVRIEHVDFQGRAEIPIDLEISRAAQDANLFLSFGSREINLGGPGPSDGATSTFTFQIAGADGVEEFSVASGTSVRDIAAFINTAKDRTGVQAESVGSGIFLKSLEFGSDRFVSIDVVDAGGVQGSGVFTLTDPTMNDIDLTKLADWGTGAAAEDRGVDFAMTLDGQPVETAGRFVKFAAYGVVGSFTFSPDSDVPYLDGGRARFTLVPRFGDRSDPGAPSIDTLA